MSKTQTKQTFKVDDKVRILPRPRGAENIFPDYVNEMTSLVGQVFPIEYIQYIDYEGMWIYIIHGWNWSSDWFEPINRKGNQYLFDFMYD